MICIGELRHRITIERLKKAEQNDHGEFDPEKWVPVMRRWADIRPANPQQKEFGRQFDASVSHVIPIRFVAGLLTTFRVRYGSRLFAIKGVIDPDERRALLHLYCTESPSPDPTL